jgi:hypothetical protein
MLHCEWKAPGRCCENVAVHAIWWETWADAESSATKRHVCLYCSEHIGWAWDRADIDLTEPRQGRILYCGVDAPSQVAAG